MLSSAKIDVIVKNEGQIIGQRQNSPIRKLPDGTAGIVVNGLVFAIYDDHSIDLSEEGIPKEDCPEFFRPGEELVHAAIGDTGDWWFFEQTDRGAYLAFDGSEEFAERLNEAFENEGSSSGYCESFRPAKNGYFYDYYIRLSPHVNEEEAYQIIAEFTKNTTETGDNETTTRFLSLIIEQLGGPRQLVARWTDLVNDKTTFEKEVIALREENLERQRKIARVEAEFASKRKEYRWLTLQMASLESDNERLREELQVSKSAAVDRELSWDGLVSEEVDILTERLNFTKNELVEAHEARDVLIIKNEELKERINKIELESNEIKESLIILQSEERPTEEFHIDHKTISKKEKQILHDLLFGAFPRLRLEDKDLKVLLREFRSISDCARVMADLQEGRNPPHTKAWHGKKGVFEVTDVNTGIKGREPMGRIYFKKSTDRNEISVAIHVKSGDGSQQEDFVKDRFR